MTNQFTEQMNNAIKPFNTLVDINTKALEQLVNQQATFINTILNDNIAHTKELTSQTDFNSAIESQKAFAEAFQAKATEAATEAYAVVSKSSEEISDVLKTAATNIANTEK
ncbi:MAG: phasin family protein [Gammaproteobacteria bacterium]|nr:phasin family protein [Gammaproteobacteria bacterium]